VSGLFPVLDSFRTLYDRYSLRNMHLSMSLALTSSIPNSVSPRQDSNKVLSATDFRIIDELVDTFNTDTMLWILPMKSPGDLLRSPLHTKVSDYIAAYGFIL
jgi:hypothetical protein